MPRAIDHLVIAACDLEGQAALYRRLGFQVGARNRHPWGTENHIIQLRGAFLELISLGPDFVASSPTPGAYSFGGAVAKFLERREGMAMLAMRSDDAESDRVAIARAGDGAFARFDFARKGRNAEGREIDVAFSLAFAEASAAPDVGFFVCQHHFPENFWSARLQAHPNGARSIAGLVFAHERPEELGEFLRRFVGASDMRRAGAGIAIQADGATLEVLPAAGVVARYGAGALAQDGSALALMRIGVADIGAVSALLAAGGTPFAFQGGAIVVAARDAMGAGIAFESLVRVSGE